MVAPTAPYTLTAVDAELTYVGSGAAVPAPPQVGGGVRRRIWVEIRDGQVYEVDDEADAVEVVKAIKRKVRRKFHQYERGVVPLAPLPEITIRGDVPQYLRERVDDANDELEALYAKALEDDEDDAMVVLLH